MGGAVTIGHLMMASYDMLKGHWELAVARGSDCEDLDDSPGPEVLALLARVQRTELSRHEEIALGVVGGLHVSYLHLGGLEGTPLSEDGMVGASGAWDVESCGDEALGLGLRDGEESVWPPLIRAKSEMEWEARVCVLQVRCGSPLQMGGRGASNEEKTIEVGVSQGDGGFRNGQMECAKWKQGLEGFK